MAKMHQGTYDEILLFVTRLPELRQLLSDVALLDMCQTHLDAFVSHINETGGKESLEPAPPPPPAPPATPTPAGAVGIPGLAATPPAATPAPAPTDGGGTQPAQ
jgi:hypothetical protein